MYFEKRYLQFNDLVFDGYDMLSDYAEPAPVKGSSTAYSYGHGSYMPLKADTVFLQERSASMTITLKLKKVPCDQRRFYVQFAMQELMKPGKLWAIKNGEIIWTNAVVKNLNPISTRKKDEYVIDVEFSIPSGVWYKADKRKTFLLPYDVCSLMDCKGFNDFNPCASARGGGDCCDACEDNRIAMERANDCGCCCETDVTADMALCYHQKELQAFYGCDTPYQLKYDCAQAKNFNIDPAFGQRLCADCGSPVISGLIYSETEIPTSDVTIHLRGKMLNPWITINGNTNIIEGEYDGILTVEPSGDVYYSASKCCEPTLLSPSVWSRPANMDYGWWIHPQFNSVSINMNVCCGMEAECAYIDHVALTI